MPGPDEPHGLGASDTRLHNAWYMMWWQMYVRAPRDTLRGQEFVNAAKVRRATLLRRPKL